MNRFAEHQRTAELSTDPELVRVRALFPVTRRWVYFNHASTGPLPATAVEAVNWYCRYQAEHGQVPYAEAEAVAEEARVSLGRLLHVAPATLAFTKNTSAGVIIAIGSIEWQPGDNVVLMSDDFPTVTYPFRYLLPEVEQRTVTSAALVQDPSVLFRLVDRRTRLVAVSWVHFLTGRRFDVAAICRFCRERGVLSLVDAIQGLGVVDLDWSLVKPDFIVSHGAKWLLSPQGSGFMYVDQNLLPRLRPFNLGWLSAQWDDFNDIHTTKPMKPGASRLEEGTKNYLAIYGLRESLKLLLECDIARVEARVRNLTGLLRAGLESSGFKIVTPPEPERSAGIITCRGGDSAALHARLTDANCTCSLRENMLRLSPHWYNTEEEVERFLAVLVGQPVA